MRSSKIHALLLVILVAGLSTASAQSWQQIAFAGQMAPVVTVDAFGGIYAGVNTSLYRSQDVGATWTQMFNTNTNHVNFIATSGLNNIFVTSEGLGVIRSTDGGTTWRQANSGIEDRLIRPVLVLPNGTILVGTSSYGIYRSTDNGDSWTAINSGLTEMNVTAIVRNQNGTLFAAVKGSNGIYSSTNDGASWTRTSMTQQYRVYTMAVGTNNYIYAGTNETYNGVYRSTDDGATWTQSGLAGQAVSIQNCFPAEGFVFATTSDRGVYRSVNYGASWDSVNTGLTTRTIGQLKVGAGGYIWAGSADGVFRSNSMTGVAEGTTTPPVQFSLLSNYPNPFNPSTMIRFNLKQAGVTKITVYNLQGDQITELMNRELSAGSHAVTFDGSNLSSGEYFYRIESGNFHEVKKMTLVK